MPWQPALSLHEVFGPGPTHHSGAHGPAFGFLPQGEDDWVSRTAFRLHIAGAMPVFCSEGLLNARWLRFYQDAGNWFDPSLPPPPPSVDAGMEVALRGELIP